MNLVMIYLYLILCGIVLGGPWPQYSIISLMHIYSRGFNRFNMIKRYLLPRGWTGVVGFYLPEALGAHLEPPTVLISNQQYLGY